MVQSSSDINILYDHGQNQQAQWQAENIRYMNAEHLKVALSLVLQISTFVKVEGEAQSKLKRYIEQQFLKTETGKASMKRRQDASNSPALQQQKSEITSMENQIKTLRTGKLWRTRYLIKSFTILFIVYFIGWLVMVLSEADFLGVLALVGVAIYLVVGWRKQKRVVHQKVIDLEAAVDAKKKQYRQSLDEILQTYTQEISAYSKQLKGDVEYEDLLSKLWQANKDRVSTQKFRSQIPEQYRNDKAIHEMINSLDTGEANSWADLMGIMRQLDQQKQHLEEMRRQTAAIREGNLQNQLNAERHVASINRLTEETKRQAAETNDHLRELEDEVHYQNRY